MSNPSNSNPDWLFDGPGEMRARCQALDWSQTSPGPLSDWPQSLRTATQMALATPFPTVILWGPELVQIYNDGYRELMGNKHPAGLGQPTQQCWPEVWHINQPIYQRVWAGESVSFEDALYPVTRSGQLEDAWFTLAYSPVLDESGQVGGVLVMVFETTDRVLEQNRRQQLQQALRQSEQRYSLLVKASSDMVYSMSADWQHMLELDGKDYLVDTATPNGNWLQQYIPPVEQERVWAAIQQAIEQQTPFEAEHQVIRQDGSLGWVVSKAISILDETGQLQQWLGAASDISERKKAEQIVQSNEERLRAQKEAFRETMNGAPLADSLNIIANMVTQETAAQARCAFYLADADGTCLHPVYGAGTMPESYLQQVDGFLIGENSLACGLAVPMGRPVITPDVFDEPLWKPWVGLAQAYGFRGCWSFPIKTRDQQAVGTFALYFPTARDAAPDDLALIDVVTQTAAIIIATYTEAHERARAEEALHQASRRKDEFLAMLGHELRNPLATLENTLLALELTGGTDESLPLEKGFQLMDQAVTQLSRMTDDLLDVSRIQHGKIQLLKEFVDLREVIKQTVESAQPFYKAAGRALYVSLPDGPLYWQADETRLGQVVMNLLTNSLKYTDEDGTVWISLEQVAEKALIRVRDNGIGIAPSELEAIFEVFVQGQTTLDRPQGGLGLGLAVVRQLVEAHGGQIQAFSSGLNQGSEFVIQLPMPIKSAPATKPIRLTGKTTPKKGQILLVDDNKNLADMTAKLLALHGYQTHVCYTGRAGLATAEAVHPDLILLDLGMSDLNGYHVCEQIRQQPWGPSITIIALTGYSQSVDRQQADAVGFNGFIVKPAGLKTLLDLVDQALYDSISSVS